MRPLLTAAALLLGAQLSSGAGEEFQADSLELCEVVVTATRTPKTLKDVPVATRVISAADIARTDASDIKELLTEELPGLEFSFAMGQETTLSMNGFGGNAILFLVDGERLAGETMDNVDYNRLNLGGVGRVEIVRGAASALYGANAVGGVVNLISKENTAPWHLSLDTRYGSEGDRWRSGGELSFNTSRWNSTTTLRHSRASAVRLTSAFDTRSAIHEIYGGTVSDICERLVFRASDRLRFIARAGAFRRVSNRTNHDDRYDDISAGLRAVWTPGSRQNLEVSCAYDRYDKARYAGETRTHDHDYSNRQTSLHALYTRLFGSNGLTAGADMMHDRLATYQFEGNKGRSQVSADAFVQFDWNPRRWLNITASLRDDYFSGSHSNALTSRLAAMFKLAPLTVRTSYAGGFRAPTLKEMYMSFDMAWIQMIYGNPDLKPERSHNFNISFERNGSIRSGILAGAYSLTAAGSYSRYDRRITTTDFPGDADREEGAIYCNEQGVRTAGADISMRLRTRSGLSLSLGYSYLHTAGRTVDSQFSQPRPHTATWRLGYDRRFSRAYSLYAAVSGRYLSRPVSRFETDTAYSLWKLTLQHSVWRGIRVNLIVDNLLDYRPEVYRWNSPPTAGRSWSAGLSLDINDFFK